VKVVRSNRTLATSSLIMPWTAPKDRPAFKRFAVETISSSSHGRKEAPDLRTQILGLP